MTQEEKELLLKDLCARLPYNVFIEDLYEPFKVMSIKDLNIIMVMPAEPYKPYLRPMSSMTEEEEKEYNGTVTQLGEFIFEQEELFRPIQLYQSIPFEMYEFFNVHHFDYRGLIEKGLALEAPEDMYGKEGEK